MPAMRITPHLQADVPYLLINKIMYVIIRITQSILLNQTKVAKMIKTKCENDTLCIRIFSNKLI